MLLLGVTPSCTQNDSLYSAWGVRRGELLMNNFPVPEGVYGFNPSWAETGFRGSVTVRRVPQSDGLKVYNITGSISWSRQSKPHEKDPLPGWPDAREDGSVTIDGVYAKAGRFYLLDGSATLNGVATGPGYFDYLKKVGLPGGQREFTISTQQIQCEVVPTNTPPGLVISCFKNNVPIPPVKIVLFKRL